MIRYSLCKAFRLPRTCRFRAQRRAVAVAKLSRMTRRKRIAISALSVIAPIAGTSREHSTNLAARGEVGRVNLSRIGKISPKQTRKRGRATYVKFVIESSSLKISFQTRTCRSRPKQINCLDLKVSTHKWKNRRSS